MRPCSMLASMAAVVSLAAAFPASTAAPASTKGPLAPVARPTQPPTPTRPRELEIRAADVDIPQVSIPKVVIPPVSIPPVSIKPVSIPPLSLDLPTPTCTPTMQPGKDGYLPPGTCGALWNYFPSFAAAVAFAVLFAVLLVAHVGQALHHRSAFSWVIVMAALWESGSYASRAAGSKDQQSTAMVTMSQILVLLAPLWVNAYAYMVFARVVHFFSPTRKVWVLSPSILALVFVSLDFVSFVIQLVGGGMAGPGSDAASQKRGIDIYMGGIGMQEAFIVIFVGLIVKFHLDQVRAERLGLLADDKRRWRPLTYALYVCLLAISLRIVFRLVEFSSGFDGPLPNNETYFYALDGAPMWIAIVVWNAIHAGRYMHGPDAKMPPSWIARRLCCCCHGGRKDVLGSHRRLRDDATDESNEMHAMRAEDGKEWSRERDDEYDGAVALPERRPREFPHR
ncbi:hypothetical protein RJ55_08659 [Drechmeria coniospora]|nr:hypothetical protein RJ55_08659 [Drechmeria coniospora]